MYDESRIIDTVSPLVLQRTGMQIPQSNHQVLFRYTKKRMAELDVTEPAFAHRLSIDAEEFQNLLNAITITETYLFREERQFDLIRKKLLPAILGTRQDPCLWSASCATGEEAYSLAVILAETAGVGRGTVFATDINTEAILRCQSGVYGVNSFRTDGRDLWEEFRPKWFIPADSQTWRVKDEIRKSIKSSPVNLFSDTYAFLPEQLDIILLRNTLIYMPIENKTRIIDRIVQRLRPNGYLILGCTEVPFLNHPDIELLSEGSAYYFRKRAQDDHSPKKTLESPRKHTSPKPVVTKPPVLETPHRNSPVPEKTVQKKPADARKVHHHAPDIHTVIAIANAVSLNQNHAWLDNAEAVRAAKSYLDVIGAINRSDSVAAQTILDADADAFGTNKIHSYLQASIHARNGDTDTAIEWFRKALAHDKEFWPAHYQLGMIHKDTSPVTSIRWLSECVEILERKPRENQDSYGFLMEHFNEEYFRQLSIKWIASLKKKKDH